MADLYLTPAEKYTAALGGFYYGDLPEPGTVYTQLIKDILDGSTPDKVPKNILARFIYSLYISDLGDPYPRYELAKLLYWKLHDITPTKSGSILTVTIDGKEDYMTINTDLSRLWYKVLFGSKTDVITEFPYVFNTMQNKFSDWELFGNTVQSGTPTPDNPVMPQGTGDKTANLCEKVEAPLSQYRIYIENFKSIIDNYLTFTLIFNTQLSYSGNTLYLYTGSNTTLGYITGTGTITKTFNLNAENKEAIKNATNPYIFVYVNNVDQSSNTNAMLVSGSTAPSTYIPYGYKIPISSANTTTPVYLGEVQTTRKIKKLVLTGAEEWSYGSAYNRFYVNVVDFVTFGLRLSPFLATHFSSCSDGRPLSEVPDNSVYSGSNNSTNAHTIYIKSTIFASINEWKAYLQQQYAAGTPVTVWYVLATETTGIVNEPLMKIGDYADSMSRAQTGIDIPTVIGQNTLDVLTTVKPSSMSIEYTSADENKSRSKRISLLKSPLKKRLIK